MVKSSIQAFLREKGTNSDCTIESYRQTIEQFLKYMIPHKDIDQLEESDLKFKPSQLSNYKSDLMDGKVTGKPCNHNTVNSKMSTLKSLYKWLSAEFDIDYDIFNQLVRAKGETKHAGYLSLEEAKFLCRNVLDNETEGAIDKGLMIELAIYTSIRLDALSKVTLENFLPHMKGFYILVLKEHNLDKLSKSDDKPIKTELYERLVQHAKGKAVDERIFHYGARTYERAIEKAVKRLGWEDRNVSFHSLKNVAINWKLDVDGDVVGATLQANHSSMDTMWKNYARRTKNYEDMAGLRMDEEMDMSAIEKLSHIELLEIIKSCSMSVQAELNMKARNRKKQVFHA